jgi:very-short-patch-repair endonuclease
MTIYIMFGSLVLLFVLCMTLKNFDRHQKPQDSLLKQRAIFSINEQLTFSRLKEILPNYTILVHVSFDALLTTKYERTRHKYRNMVADFVILDELFQIQAIVAIDDSMSLRRSHADEYEDSLLKMAGYHVIRYYDVPEYYQLRQDFLPDLNSRAFSVKKPKLNKQLPEYNKQKAFIS